MNLINTKQLSDGVSLLELNRPEKRNALSIELLRNLCDAVKKLEADDSQRVLIIRGIGKVFCAGLDLSEAQSSDRAHKSAELVGEMLQTVYETKMVTIAAVHGAAIAGGAGLMSACDLVVAENATKIGYPEVHRGLVAALVLGLLCTQVPRRKARELLILGEIIDAEEALKCGLITRLCRNGGSLQTAQDLAHKVLLGGPLAIQRTKQAINDFTGSSFRSALASAMDGHLAARDSDEAKEGFAAFLEKRPPNWIKKR